MFYFKDGSSDPVSTEGIPPRKGDIVNFASVPNRDYMVESFNYFVEDRCGVCVARVDIYIIPIMLYGVGSY